MAVPAKPCASMRRRAAACSLLATLAAASTSSVSADRPLGCFQGAYPYPVHSYTQSMVGLQSQLDLVSITRRSASTHDALPASLPTQRLGASAALSCVHSRRRRSIVAANAKKSNDSTEEDGDEREKKGWFGFGGSSSDPSKQDDDSNDKSEKKSKRSFFRRDNRDDKESKKEDEKRQKDKNDPSSSSSESGPGILRRLGLRRSSADGSDQDDKKRNKKQDKDSESKGKGLNLPKVDINSFVGPRLPDLGSEIDVQAELQLSAAEVARKEKARRALEKAQAKRIEAQQRKEAKIREAAERAEKLAAERKVAEERKREILERQRAVREAAKSGKSSGAAKGDKTAGDDEASAPEGRGRRWPNISFGGGGEDNDKRDANEKKSKKDKKDGEGGGILSGLSSIFGGSGEKEDPSEWIVVCPKTRVAPGVIVPIVAGGLDLLIVASKDGKRLACIANSCPHLGTPLEGGIVERRPAAGAAARRPDLAEDGCEDCIVCPTHNTAFALESGEVRGDWCPYPPVIGQVMGAVKTQANLPTFQIRARGKNIEVRLASSLDDVKG